MYAWLKHTIERISSKGYWSGDVVRQNDRQVCTNPKGMFFKKDKVHCKGPLKKVCAVRVQNNKLIFFALNRFINLAKIHCNGI